MLQALIASWIFLLFIAALFVDDNLRHVIPTSFGAFLIIVIVTIPVWIPVVLSDKSNRNKKNEQIVENSVLE